MKLISLKTQGFKRLRNHTFNFTDGLNVIVGDNAAGKSTLLQAIECALYGASVVPGKKEHMITWGQKTWKVELTFSLGETRYLLTRSKSTAKLESYGFADSSPSLEANGATPVTQAVEELLGLSAKDYNLFMQSKQGETSGVLTFGAAALNRKVEAFSGISTIDDVHQLALEDHRTAKAKIEALSFDPADLDMLHNDLAMADSEAKESWFNVEATRQALEGATRPEDVAKPVSDPDAMQRQRDALVKLERRREMAKRDLAHAESAHAEAKQRIDEVEKPQEAADLEPKLRDLNAQIKTAVVEVNRLNAELLKQQTLFNDLSELELVYDQQRSEDVIGEELAGAVDELTSAEESSRRCMDNQATLNADIKRLASLKEDAVCPTCNTKLSDHDPEQLDKEVADLTQKRDLARDTGREFHSVCLSLKKRVSTLEVELSNTQETEAKVDQLREQLVGMGVVLHTGYTPTEGELEKAEEVRRSLALEHSRIEYQLEQLEAETRRYETLQRSVARTEKVLKESAQEVEVLSAELAESGKVPSEELIAESREHWKLYEQRVSDARIQRAERQSEANQAKQAWETACKNVERLKGDVERLEKRAEELKDLKVMADKAARLAKFLGERRAGYLQEVWDAVLSSASKQVNTASRGMVSRLAFKDGDFFFEEEGVLAPVSSASGAQKAHIGVAVRIGLSRALYGKDALLIFDEPTESMREHHAIGLSSSLAGAASQCLLITHREQDQDLASNVVEVS